MLQGANHHFGVMNVGDIKNFYDLQKKNFEIGDLYAELKRKISKQIDCRMLNFLFFIEFNQNSHSVNYYKKNKNLKLKVYIYYYYYFVIYELFLKHIAIVDVASY